MFLFRRREFLASLFYASAFVSLPAWARVGLKPPGERRVLVIGAGISGLQCASLLERKSFTVEILEASDRIGGKLLGRKVGPHMFDLGGQALSLKMKRVTSLGEKLGLTLIPRPKQKEFFLRDGKRISGRKVEALRKEINAAQNSIVRHFSTLGEPAKRKKHSQISVHDWLKGMKLSPDAEAMFRSTFVAEWCDSPENVSFLHYLEFSHSNIGEEGDMDFRYREGFFGMAEKLRNSLKASLHLSTPAEGVLVEEDRVRVFSGSKEFHAHYVILATPLPQMKDLSFTGLFAGDFQESLSLFQGAFVKKVIVLYKKRFWAETPSEGLFDPPLGLAIMENSDLEKKIFSIVVFAGGAEAEISREAVLAKLAEAFGSEALSPLAYVEESWSGSRYMTGGYASNRRRGATGYQRVPRQLGPRVLLAGADTADSFPSYVEGALSSAERAVELLLKYEYRTKVDADGQ